MDTKAVTNTIAHASFPILHNIWCHESRLPIYEFGNENGARRGQSTFDGALVISFAHARGPVNSAGFKMAMDVCNYDG